MTPNLSRIQGIDSFGCIVGEIAAPVETLRDDKYRRTPGKVLPAPRRSCIAYPDGLDKRLLLYHQQRQYA